MPGSELESSNEWQELMYDEFTACHFLETPELWERAEMEVRLLARVLALSRGYRVLDIPCGTGRHSVEFAKLGLSVTAIDISPACLKLAGESSRGLSVRLERGDMSDLGGHRGEFDAVCNLGNSFGLFATEEQNEVVLDQLVSAVRPKGKLALQVLNREWYLKTVQMIGWATRDGMFKMQASRYDRRTKRLETQFVFIEEESGLARRYYSNIRLFDKDEVVGLMKRSGLRDIQIFGDSRGNRFKSHESQLPIYTATTARFSG